MIYLSVIIPSYNETENLKRGVLNEVRDYLQKQTYSWEVVVVDDESPDEESRNLARIFCEQNKGFKFIQAAHSGKVGALWTGVQAAVGQYILFTDMDQSTPISELEKILTKYQENYDIVIGSRGLERKNSSFFRKFASLVFRNFRNIVLSTNIIDTQAGFKAFKATVLKELFPKLSAVKKLGAAQGWTVGAWDVEFLVLASSYGYKIAEVPISWADRDESVAKAKERKQGKFVKESIDMAKEVLRVKYNLMLGRYKK